VTPAPFFMRASARRARGPERADREKVLERAGRLRLAEEVRGAPNSEPNGARDQLFCALASSAAFAWMSCPGIRGDIAFWL